MRAPAASTRTLARRLAEQLAKSPGNWLLRQRVMAARALLEETDLAVETIAARTGLSSAANLRWRFHALVHTTPAVAGQADINTTMGYNAVYPTETIEAHRAFITRRRTLRPAEEYRTPTDAEWEDFLGHFERRQLSVCTCARAYGTACIHEHACVRCSLLRPDPAQRGRLEEIRDNLVDRIAEAEREGWLGEVEGLRVSLAGAEDKLVHMDRQTPGGKAINLSMPRILRLNSWCRRG